MTYIEIFLLAIALSIDAFVVSFTYGLAFNENRTKNSLLLASSTGFFQFIMPVLGYFLTNFVRTFIEPYAPYIVFIIFVFLGVKFVLESINGSQKRPDCISQACLFMIGIATSIDAFSAGISLSLYGNKILKPALLIGTITFLNSTCGFGIGGNLKKLSTKWLETLAGIILIALGIKALF